MKRVKLEYDHTVTIEDAAFEQIAAIVKNSMVCETCEKPYTPERPQVARNRCLPCFLRFHQSNPLRYVGVLMSESDTPVHGFLDGIGYINPSTRKDEIQSLKQSNRSTLNFYGYPVPLTLLLEGETEERRLDSSSFCWQMHGEFKKGQSVLVLEYNQPWGDHIKLLFLSYRHTSETVLLDRRKGQGYRLFREASRTIKATKDGNIYRYKGRDSYKIYDSDLYELVSQLASSEYDQQKQKTQE